MQIVRYSSDRKKDWDEFVKNSKNGTFLFLRDYMDYHSDRFKDHSLMFYNKKGALIGVMPSNENDGVLYSHQGLTYGGIVIDSSVVAEHVMKIFDVVIEYLRLNGFTELRYKPVPTCYHRCPSEEDEYALWRHGASLRRCLISATVSLSAATIQPKIERRRQRGLRKAREKGYTLRETDDIELFWPIMLDNLESRYSAKPVHSLEEMKLLKSRFPQNIVCYLVEDNDGIEGGCIAYIANDMCVHIQYGHATPKGKEDGVLDLLYISLIEKYRNEGYKYLDFGTSNEDDGRILNENLIAQKEGFGGRGTVYKEYVCPLL